MTDGDSAGEASFVKTDTLGRIRTTREQREALLDAFEAGGLSGPEFTRIHGINYQTFATWRQKRRRERGEGGGMTTHSTSGPGVFTLIEAQVTEADGTHEAPPAWAWHFGFRAPWSARAPHGA